MPDSFLAKTAIALGVAIALAGCNRSAPSSGRTAQHYETRGIVRGFSPDRKTIEIEHENIPGFMPSMTMPFSARDQKEVADLRLGDGISFRLAVTEKDFWIDRVQKIPAIQVRVIAPTPAVSSSGTGRLRDGDEMPRFTLTDQDGKRITPDTFRGQPFVLTFIFTRCPIPNFCPRMSNNFSELQRAIQADHGLVGRTRLLSISFDPGFDSPQTLKEYGASHGADKAVWSFATGDPKEIDALTHAFSIYVQTEGGTVSHGLATALVDEKGKIDKIWRGNGWTPNEVVEEIKRH